VTDAPRPPRLALSQQEAAEALGVSADFFQHHLRHEIRCVRRGRRRLYPVAELQRWLEEQATRALETDSSLDFRN
jgi:excisionase family DNA binding protein